MPKNESKKNKRNSPKMNPAIDNDQLGENASEEFAEDYALKGKTTKKKQK